jgi:hypothetical protein
VSLAARGARETADGVAAIEDRDEARQLRRQAGRIHLESVAIAVTALGLVMIARGFVGT